MFEFFNKKPSGEKITFKIDGMHCTSCSLTIDGELEETTGVISANTNYAQSKTTIEYDPEKIKPLQLRKVIESLEYKATELT